MVHQIVKSDERELSFEMGVLAEMATGMAVLGTETLLHAEDISQAGEASLQVQLRALGEESRLAVVVQLEEGGSAFDLGLDKAGRGDFDEVVGSQGFAEGGQHVGAEAEDARSVLSTEDEVAEIGLDGGIRFLDIS